MSGLLSTGEDPRVCPSCHSPMAKVPGRWGMPSVDAPTTNKHIPLHMQEIVFACYVYRCPNCLHLELVDTE